MFFYVIIIAYNLFIAGLLCVFNFSNKCDKHWFQVLNQIVANDSSNMISKIRFSLRYIKVSTISINVALIGFSLPITWIAYNRTDFVIYGVPSIALFFNALSCAARDWSTIHINFNNSYSVLLSKTQIFKFQSKEYFKRAGYEPTDILDAH